MAKIIGISEKEKAKLIKQRDAAITALAKFCDALDATFGDEVAPPAKKPRAKKAKPEAQPGDSLLPPLRGPNGEVVGPLVTKHPGMKVVKKGANGAAHPESQPGTVEL